MSAIHRPSYILTLDAGTTGVKCAAFDREGGALFECVESYPTRYPAPGWAEQQPEEDRSHWIVIAARRGTVDEYLEKRARGLNPKGSLEPFVDLLSYRPEEGVSTGYDAWRDLFPRAKER